jgi:predicted AlkP superfamily phosphohydrolase/phosphomutase
MRISAQKNGRAFLSALVAAVMLLLPGCSTQAKITPSTGKKIIVLGIDGMDPKYVESHWGDFPNLNKLRQQGEFRRLGTTIPPQSPVAWSTFITGMDPGGHGIYDFIHRNPDTAMPFSSMSEISEPGKTLSIGPYVLPLTSGKVRSLRNGKAFWQSLAEHNIPVNVIRMPTNFPPIEAGHSLSGMGTPDMRGTFGTFTFFTDKPSPGDADHHELKPRQVPGGIIVPITVKNHRAELRVEGPSNTLRKDQMRTAVTLTVDIDPQEPVARFQTGDVQFILKQGEWSPWIKAGFTLIPAVKDAAGMFRVYAKELRPFLQVYVSPINIDPAHPELPITYPEQYSQDLNEAIGPFYTQGMAEDTAALRQGVFNRDEYLAQSRLVATEHLKLLRHELDRFDNGLLFFHFFGVDQNSHMMWGKFDEPLLQTYKMVDEAVGWVMEKAGDATIVVMSDHGFSTFDRAVHLNSLLMQEGFLALDDPNNAGSDELFVHVDWSRTRAYALGLNALYLNLFDRERNGIVDRVDSESLLKKIAGKLLAYRDPKNGKQVVDTVYFPREHFHGDMVESAPDLLIGYAEGYRASWQTALGAIPKSIVEDNNEAWVADHCIAARFVPGVLISNRKSTLDDPKLQDLTVSLLSEFGVSKPEGSTGRVIY